MAAQAQRRRTIIVRTTVFVLVALLVIAALVWGIIAGATWIRDTVRGQDAERAASVAQTIYPNPVACDPAALSSTAEAPTEAAVGGGVTASLTIRNTGSLPCLLEAGGANLGMMISSGGQMLLSTPQCASVPAERQLLIAAGESTTVQIQWDGTIANDSCLPTQALLPAADSSAVSASATPTDGGRAGSDSAGTSASDAASGQASEAASEQASQAVAGEAASAEAEQADPAAGDAVAASAAGAGDAATQASASPSPSATATPSVQPGVLQVSGGGATATAGTYHIEFQLDGRSLGVALPLVLG